MLCMDVLRDMSYIFGNGYVYIYVLREIHTLCQEHLRTHVLYKGVHIYMLKAGYKNTRSYRICVQS